VVSFIPLTGRVWYFVLDRNAFEQGVFLLLRPLNAVVDFKITPKLIFHCDSKENTDLFLHNALHLPVSDFLIPRSESSRKFKFD